MPKKTAKNNELLKSSKIKTSPKLYPLLVQLVNDDKEELAEVVLKTDYLLEYASTCIKQRDHHEAKEGLNKAKERIDILKSKGVDTGYLEYLYEGISKKAKS